MNKLQPEQELLSNIIIHNKYARYIPELKRREVWDEIVDRNKKMHLDKFKTEQYDLNEEDMEEFNHAYSMVYDKKLLPSLRSMQFGGKPVEINNTRIYNCSYLPMDNWKSFHEVMFLLLSGTGVGIGVQKHQVECLPEITFPTKERRYLVGDSIEGWSDAVQVLMKSYFGLTSSRPNFDFRAVREKGQELVTSGGKAPGPEPLQECLFQIEKILKRKKNGEKLFPIEVHDIVCHIADAVLSGGIRRAALISLFSVDDNDMLYCKTGNWWEANPQRGRANNSAVFVRHRLTKEKFDEIWKIIKASNSGEPGIFFTNDKDVATNPCISGDSWVTTEEGPKQVCDIIGKQVKLLKDGNFYSTTEEGFFETGFKPVYELKLKNGMKIKATDNHKFLLENGGWKELKDLNIGDNIRTSQDKENDDTSSKIEYISYIGEETVYDCTVPETSCFSANGIIVHNCGEVSLKSFQFCNLTEINASTVLDQNDLNERVKAATIIGTIQATYTNFHYLREIWKTNTEKEALLGVSLTGIASGALDKLDLKEAASVCKKTNEKWAKKLRINKAARITTVKPSGTASIVLGTSSGIHAWHNDYYIRRIRLSKNESIYKYLQKNNPELLEDDITKPHIQSVLSVPQSAPEGSVLRSENVLDFLARIKKYNLEWVRNGFRKGANHNNVSATVSIKDNEWGVVGEWMWDNREYFNGLSVLPYSDSSYVQSPFEDCTEEQYKELVKLIKNIDLSQVKEYSDNTNFGENLACSGGSCEII